MKKYTQFGTFLVLIVTPFLLVMTLSLFKIGIPTNAESISLLITCLILLACLIGFYKLTITVEENHISFKLGTGWFGKKYKFSEIVSCKPVKNQFLYGIGIRWIIGKGWLYNVSGFKAVELRFKNKKSIVRIGTNKPEEICKAIRKKLSDNE